MKKILSLALVIVMIAALSLSTFAAKEPAFSFDRLFVNETTLDGTDKATEDPLKIAVGDKLYILAWVVMDSGMKEVVYTIDGGADVKCADNYRGREDLAGHGPAQGFENEDYSHAGVGHDDNAFELVGIDKLTDGTYDLKIVAISNAGERCELKALSLVVGTGVNPEKPNPETADAAVVAVIAVACIALAGVVVCKKVRA